MQRTCVCSEVDAELGLVTTLVHAHLAAVT